MFDGDHRYRHPCRQSPSCTATAGSRVCSWTPGGLCQPRGPVRIARRPAPAGRRNMTPRAQRSLRAFPFVGETDGRGAGREFAVPIQIRWARGWLTSAYEGIRVDYLPPKRRGGPRWLAATLDAVDKPDRQRPAELIHGSRILRLECSWPPVDPKIPRPRFPLRVLSVIFKGGGGAGFPGCDPAYLAGLLDEVCGARHSGRRGRSAVARDSTGLRQRGAAAGAGVPTDRLPAVHGSSRGRAVALLALQDPADLRLSTARRSRTTPRGVQPPARRRPVRARAAGDPTSGQ